MRRAGHDQVSEVSDAHSLRIGRRCAGRKRSHRGGGSSDTAAANIIFQVSDDLVRNGEVAGAQVHGVCAGLAPVQCQRAVMSPSLQHRQVRLVAEVPDVKARRVGGKWHEGAVDGVVVKAGERSGVSDGSNHCGFGCGDGSGTCPRVGSRIAPVAGIGRVIANAVDESALAALVLTYDGATHSTVDVSREVAVNACGPVDGVGAACMFHHADQSAVFQARPANTRSDNVRMRDDCEGIGLRHDSPGDAAGDSVANRAAVDVATDNFTF